MKILVTGGYGYIGGQTAILLKKKNHQVFLLDNLSQGKNKAVEKFPLFKVDLRDKKKVFEVFKRQKFSAVIHFAGLIAVGESMKKPDLYFENNITGTINLLNAMSEFKVKFFVFSSSAAVYGNPEKIPISEADLKLPTNAYGQTKLMVEQLLPWYENAFGMKNVCLRYFNACGASLDGKNGENHKPETHIIPLIMRTALGKQEKFLLFGNDYPTKDGTCIRDYVHVVDLAEAHLQAVEYLKANGPSQAFNVGTGKGFSNLEIVKMIQKITRVNFKFEFAPRREGDPAELVAGNKKIKQILKWKPKFSGLETIIETAYRWHKNNPQTLKN